MRCREENGQIIKNCQIIEKCNIIENGQAGENKWQFERLKGTVHTGIYIALITILFFGCKDKPVRLPFLQLETTERVVDGKTVIDSAFRTIPSFKLLNQDSAVVTEKDFDGKIYVADFFFTSCPTICPTMHRNLLKVYKKYEGNPEVKFASHTIDVKYDTPSRMKAYANKLGIKGTQWEYLWGSRDEIYALAERNYLVAAQEDKSAPGGFVHQGYLVLVDKEKRIRGAYDGTLDNEVQKLMDDMDILLNEYIYTIRNN